MVFGKNYRMLPPGAMCSYRKRHGSIPPRCPFHKYTASVCGLASFPRKRESRGRTPWGLDARLRGHDILLVQDLRNGHLVPRLMQGTTANVVRRM